MTFSIASPSAQEIAAAPRAFAIYRQSLAADDSVDPKVRQLRHRGAPPLELHVNVSIVAFAL